MNKKNSGEHPSMAGHGHPVRSRPTGLRIASLVLGGALLSACSTVHSVQQYLTRDEAPATASPTASTGLSATLAPLQGAGQEVYRGRYSYVRVVPAETGAATSFPVYLDEDRLRGLLKELLGAPNASFSDRPLFSRDEVAELVPPLKAALALAHSGEDVLFAVSGTHKPLSFSETESVTTGRVFVADGRLNLILGMTRVNFGDALKAAGTLRNFDQASRQASLATAEAVRGASWSLARADRLDWLTVPMDKLGYFGGTLAAPATVTIGIGAASGGRAPILPAAAPASAPANVAAPVVDEGAAERRLATLERLRQKGLITQQEFDAKRRTVLDGL